MDVLTLTGQGVCKLYTKTINGYVSMSVHTHDCERVERKRVYFHMGFTIISKIRKELDINHW